MGVFCRLRRSVALFICPEMSVTKPTGAEMTHVPSVYYLRPRTGSLQESFDPSKESHLFSSLKTRHQLL